jgi:acylphosphatase
VTGWVRNLYDGTVEAEAEGTQADIDMMIAAIKRGRFIEIDSMDISEIPLKGDAVFNIR